MRLQRTDTLQLARSPRTKEKARLEFSGRAFGTVEELGVLVTVLRLRMRQGPARNIIPDDDLLHKAVSYLAHDSLCLPERAPSVKNYATPVVPPVILPIRGVSVSRSAGIRCVYN